MHHKLATNPSQPEPSTGTKPFEVLLAQLLHDIKNQLMLLEVSNMSLAAHPDEAVVSQAKDQAAILSNVNHQLVELLCFYKTLDGNYQPYFRKVDLLEWVEEQLWPCLPLASSQNKSLDLKGEPLPKPVTIECALLSPVVRELVLNALKYGNEQVVVSVTMDEPHGVQITVEDDGPGFPDDMDFDEAETKAGVTTNQAGSTQLGLSLMKIVIDIHKGQYPKAAVKFASSEQLGGAKVTLSLR